MNAVQESYIRDLFEFLRDWYAEGDAPIHAGALVGNDGLTFRDAVELAINAFDNRAEGRPGEDESPLRHGGR